MADPDRERSAIAEVADAGQHLELLVHQATECLTAIRIYTAGVRTALRNDHPDRVDGALAMIEAQVVRAHALLRAMRTTGASGQNDG